VAGGVSPSLRLLTVAGDRQGTSCIVRRCRAVTRPRRRVIVESVISIDERPARVVISESYRKEAEP
jgi:hypothetical protein